MKKGMIVSFVVLAFVTLAFAAATKFTDLQVTNNLTVDQTTTLNKVVLGSAWDVSVATPAALGQIVRTSAYVVYIASGTSSPSQWIKVGGQ